MIVRYHTEIVQHGGEAIVAVEEFGAGDGAAERPFSR